jgi:hypothetical protein
VTVQYATTGGDATGGATCADGVDYLTTAGTLTFAPGETSKTVTVTVCGDALAESTETVGLDLSNPVQARVAKRQALGAIQDDDTVTRPAPSVQTQPVPGNNGNGGLQVRIGSPPSTSNSQTVTAIKEIRFGTFENARVTLNGQPVASGQTVTFPPNTTSIDLKVERITPGQPTHVPFVVVDSLGEFPTFVGGGASAGF